MNSADSWLPEGSFQPRRYRPGGIGNWSGHLPFARDLVAAHRPGLLVELGTHFGESYFGFCQAVLENNLSCKCYAVDNWLGEQHAGFYDESVFQDVSSYNERNYNAFSYLMRTNFDEARHGFSDGSIDILHIDGLHTYPAVRHDFNNWFPAVKPGGIILLHDTSARHADFGVWKLWDELEKLGQRFAFLHNWGLGVFRKPGGEPGNSFLSALFSAQEDRCNHIRQFYSLCARSLEYDHFRPRVQDPHRPTSLLQIYPEGENGYSPGKVYERAFNTKDWEHIRVDLASGLGRSRLRIDISDHAGVIDVAGLSVRKAVNDEPIFRATGAAELAALPVGGTMTRFEYGDSTEFCRYISSGNDPQLFVELDATLTDQPLVLDLWVRVDTEVTLLLPWLTGQRRDASGALVSEKADLEALVSSLRATIAELEGQIGELKRETVSGRQERESFVSTYRRAQGEVYVLKRDLEEARGDLAKATGENEKLLAETAALELRRASLESTLNGILTSRSWKVTSPIRRWMEGRRSE